MRRWTLPAGRRVWFTADTHFGHGRILKTTARGCTSLAEMAARLTHQWNACVGPDDLVFHLGDFALGDKVAAAAALAGLQGEKHLIIGNHDRASIQALPDWAGVHEGLEINMNGQLAVLLHYPMREWNGFWRGAWHLYGHVHGRMAPTRQSCDVGVDAWAMTPVGPAAIAARLAAADSPLAP